jgi:hypothetical protein
LGNPSHIDTTMQIASMRQIHAAIEHLKKGDFECAITLGGAGEGMLINTDKPHLRSKVKELAVSLKDDPEPGAKDPNDYITWLKHGTFNGKKWDTARIPEHEAICIILRSISKFHAVYGFISPNMMSFNVWATKRLQSDQGSN